MRTVHWLFVLSLLLFVSGVGFVIAAGRTARTAPSPAGAAAPALPPVADVKQVMGGIVAPAAAFIWNSVATTVSAKGIEETRPETDDDWAKLATSAAVLAESANLLRQGGRAPDNADWPRMAQAMGEAAGKAMKAAAAKDVEGILAVGEEINITCDTCHERYSRD
jgi:hypothetical protein